MIANPTFGSHSAIEKLVFLKQQAKKQISEIEKFRKISKLATTTPQEKEDEAIAKLRASKYRVKSHFANVRIGPGKSYQIIRVLHKDHKIEVIEARGKWLRIGEDSWISRLTLSPY